MMVKSTFKQAPAKEKYPYLAMCTEENGANYIVLFVSENRGVGLYTDDENTKYIGQYSEGLRIFSENDFTPLKTGDKITLEAE